MTMLVPFVCGPGDLRLRAVATPRAGPGDVVLRVASVGVCGSDLGFIAMGGVAGPAAAPFPLGHELSGVVEDAGADVTTVAVGDRVAVNPLVNLIGNGGAEGGFAERLLVRDVARRPGSLLRLPEAVSLEEGALVEPLAVAAHALNRLGAGPGDRVAIHGAGPIGLACTLLLRAGGVDDVVVLDPAPFRRERAARLGARAVVDPLAQDPAAALAEAHGRVPLFRRQAPGTTHFIEASGAPVLPQIVALARERAAICVVSLHKAPVAIDFAQVMTKELTLTGALGYPTELAEAIALVAGGTLDLAPLVSHRFAAADVLAAFAAAAQPDAAAKVLVTYSA